jgi:D-lactate dehydrogenase (cytochrome)
MPEIIRDSEILEAYLEDASGAPPGEAAGLVRIASEAEASTLLRRTLADGARILCQAARTSLTGGAIPRRELIVSVERMAQIDSVERGPTGAVVRVQPGVRLDSLREDLARLGLYYPPVPTYEQAMIGGSVATNAGGAATFKYGVTRQWVRGLRVLLFNGDLIELERGQIALAPEEELRIQLSDGGELRVPVPDYELPDLKKVSAGYHAADPLDPLDLFIGSEGTLGLITSITLELIPLPPSVVTGLVFLDSPSRALGLAADLREAALVSRERGDPAGPDVRAIESIDAGGLDLLRSSGEATRLRIRVPDVARAALLFEMELPHPVDNEAAQRLLMRLLEDGSISDDGPLTRLFRILLDHGALEALEFAFPEDEDRRRALKEFREAVPRRVSEILRERRREEPGIRKVAGDLIVPFERLAEIVRFYERGFVERGLQYAIWGHLSDGNLHPNALPRDAGEVKAGVQAVLDFADEAVRLGGCPLSEHGVGRDPLKQTLLRRFLGGSAIDSMRRIKRALDPPGRFAPGVLFPAD